MSDDENDLERALRLAADEPGHRPAFYKILLDSTVYILGELEKPAAGGRTIAAGEHVFIQDWVKQDGSPVVPFFSSMKTLRRAIEAERSYLEIPARSLFDLTKGKTLMLNPKSPYGKEFFPNEIAAMLSYGVNRLPERRVTTAPTTVLLGQPKDYPSKMVESLTTLFAKRRDVKAAYLVQMHDPSRDAVPHIVVGIEAGGNFDEVAREAGTVAADCSPSGAPVDLIRVMPKDKGLSEHMLNKVKPFYERRWGGKLKSLLGIGRA
jgi:hypothetical protein